LGEYRDFIDRWLEASEEPRPRPLTQEEQQLRSVLRAIAKGFKRHYDKSFIEATIRKVVKSVGESANLTDAQIEESIDDAVSTL